MGKKGEKKREKKREGKKVSRPPVVRACLLYPPAYFVWIIDLYSAVAAL
jgi:hypothetical protein